MPPANKFRFLFDEDLHLDIAHFLKREGHEVMLVPKGVRNGAVFRLAISERCALLSGDKDFLNKDLFPPSKTRGVLVVRLHPPDPSLVIPHLTKFLNTSSPKRVRGKLFSIERHGVVAQ